MGANARNVEVAGSSAKREISIYIGRRFSRMFLDLLFLWIAYDKILSNFCFFFFFFTLSQVKNTYQSRSFAILGITFQYFSLS